MNQFTGLGNLTRDVELRYLQNGSAVATTGLAMNRRFKKQDGSQGEEVCFIDLTFFGRTAEIANQYLSRGRRVLVTGRLKLDQWTDQQGIKRSKHSIQVDSLEMIDSQSNGSSDESPVQHHHQPQARTNQAQNQPNDPPRQQQRGQSQFAGHDIPEIDINDDEIPF